MTTSLTSKSRRGGRPLPLENGARLRAAEYERRYDATPGLKKAELIDGIAYVHEPVRFVQHAQPDAHLVAWLGLYAARTPGTSCAANVTLRLDDDNEPQPDCALLLDPALGGQCHTDADGYLGGAPELVVETAASSASYDLHQKLDVYRRHGVREYVVARMLEGEVDWFFFDAPGDPNRGGCETGVLASERFPGLWLDVGAFLGGDLAGMLRTLEEGIGSDEHRRFLAELGGRRG